jgi:regulator of nonsense transcripts 2
MSDAPARGRGRGGGRKGGRGGRGRGRGGGPKQEGGKPPPAPSGGGRGEGGGRGDAKGGRGKSKPRRRNDNSNATNKAPVLSEAEKFKLEEEKRAAEEAKAAEAERQRLQEEERKLQAARDAKRQEQKALCERVQQAIDSLMTLSESAQTHKKHRTELAAERLVLIRKNFEASKKTLKSDLKKCTAFVKKVKTGTAWSMKPADMERDVASLNLTRYVEEVAGALVDAKLKVTDLPTVVALCHAMHCRYADFLPSLLPALWSGIHGNTTDAKLRRVHLRLLTEFLLHGIVFDTKPLLKLMTDVTGAAKGYAVADATLVVSFVKAAGFGILSTHPRSIQVHMNLLDEKIQQSDDLYAAGKSLDVADDAAPEDIPQCIPPELATKAKAALEQVQEALQERAVTPPISEVFLTHSCGAFEALCKTWVETDARLQKLEKRCEQDRLLQGNLSEAREKGLTDARKLNENLQKTVEALSDILDKPMPVFETEEEEEKQEGGPGLELWTKGEGDESNDFGPFDDEETRSFYCDIPDLLTTIPPALLGMGPEEIEKLQAENLRKHGSDAVADDSAAAAEVEPISEAEFEEEEEQETKEEETQEDNEENKDTPHYRLQVLLEQELPECSRREQVDELAEKFCVNHGTSKNSRKRLTKALFQVPRTRLDLLPHYSRIAATMDRIYPDISAPLTTDLEQQFHGQAKFKKQQNPEGRLKTARYLGELTKFHVAPPIVSLRCLRRCLDDFSGFNIDIACCLLESCGRFLYRTKHTVANLTALMDTMMRISKAKNLDERYQSLINSAFFMVKPPPAGPRKMAKVYPPLEAYLRYLLLVKLEPTEPSVSFVTKQLLKFPWGDPAKQCGALICKYMLKACRKGRYKAISAVASVAASVRRTKPEVAARLIDACIEEIQWSMEHPSFRDQQRTITYARLLGEMQAASLITGPIVIQQLYNFINFNHDIPEGLHEASAKQLSEASEEKDDSLPVYNSANGVSQAIQEDEEMEDEELETKQEAEAPKAVAVSPHSIYDPRVPSQIDLPNSAFRIKLVCTLLEASAKHIVTRNNLSNLEGFVTAFQRYLFTKTSLPTDVEFALLDTFDSLDSQWKKTTSRDNNPTSKEEGFPRYESWIDAHNATVAKEEDQAMTDKRSRARLEALAGVGEANLDILNDDDLAMMDAADDDDYYASDVDDTDSEDDIEEEEEAAAATDDDTETHEDDMDEDEESEVDSDEYEDYDDEEEFDEEAYMKQLEEEAFEHELRRMTKEALEKGKNTARAGALGKVADNMPSGSQFIRKKHADSIEDEGPVVALGGQEGINFQLLKKGNKGKVEAKKFVVPKDTNLAIRASKQDGAADREHDIIKARVLEYEAESAIQEASGGNVYLEQTKLQVIRNRPVLSMEVIDRNFGTSRGERQPISENRTGSSSGRGGQPVVRDTQSSGRVPYSSGRGPGRGRGRGRGGRTLKNF